MLARGILNSMLMNQLKIATIALCLVIGSSYRAWQTFAVAGVEDARRSRSSMSANTAGMAKTADPQSTTGTWRSFCKNKARTGKAQAAIVTQV